ncbi:hypothetical protein PF005_g28937 [Phytophthora fragariae]|nr:hypothetical protein PF009_g27929 [Phytophthora fragariae]KAE9068725.1 hypothetical protein PF007_g27573 [Phytophthora fragariae]KAE9167049.1 hypothetical protein PF005_g28937 [Phytophthora fragariae]KAE9267579.1 hypothetical protein PF001_g30018 [Phytophthora fragariae]
MMNAMRASHRKPRKSLKLRKPRKVCKLRKLDQSRKLHKLRQSHQCLQLLSRKRSKRCSNWCRRLCSASGRTPDREGHHPRGNKCCSIWAKD